VGIGRVKTATFARGSRLRVHVQLKVRLSSSKHLFVVELQISLRSNLFTLVLHRAHIVNQVQGSLLRKFGQSQFLFLFLVNLFLGDAVLSLFFLYDLRHCGVVVWRPVRSYFHFFSLATVQLVL